MSDEPTGFSLDPDEENLLMAEDGTIADRDITTPGEFAKQIGEESDTSPSQDIESRSDSSVPVLFWVNDGGEGERFEYENLPEQGSLASNNNTEEHSSALKEMLDETIEERPQVLAYSGSIVLMMVSFYLSSPLFAVLGGGLLVLTSLHYAG